jgi:regulator of RNase E activity RraA
MNAKRIELPKDLIEAYAHIDVSCIGDVVRGAGLNCLPEGLLPIGPGMKVCGQAVTVRQVASPDGRSWVRHEEVMMKDAGGRTDGSICGALMAANAKRRGLNGMVIDGACRDTEEIKELGWPVFARGVTNRNSHAVFYTCCINNEPVQVGVAPFCVMVAPGDLVIGDADGVVVVPQHRAVDLLPAIQERHENDEEAMRLIQSGADGSRVEKLAARVVELENVTLARD